MTQQQNSKANELQIGGSHYRSGFQHWDLVLQLKVGYIEGCITKYLVRWRSKNGLEDLKKANHYLTKLIEASGGEYQNPADASDVSRETLQKYFAENDVPEEEKDIMQQVFLWRSTQDLQSAQRAPAATHDRQRINHYGMTMNQRFSAAFSQLKSRDKDLANVLETFGEPEDRIQEPCFETLASTIVGQQVSSAAARSVWNKFVAAGYTQTAKLAKATDEELREQGVSRQKAGYLRSLAEHVESGELCFSEFPNMEYADVKARLVAVKGIGEWTADCFCLFGLAELDAWPHDDLALQEGYRLLCGLEERPTGKQLKELGARWAPLRGAAALLLWHLFGSVKRGGNFSPSISS